MPDLADTLTEALFHLSKPTASCLLGEMGVKPSPKNILPPEIEAALQSFVSSESRIFLNPSLLSATAVEDEDENLVESAVKAFAVRAFPLRPKYRQQLTLEPLGCNSAASPIPEAGYTVIVCVPRQRDAPF